MAGTGRDHLQQALAAQPALNKPPPPTRLDVVLEKHGEFYHPARIEVPAAEGPFSIALNVAVTTAGRECMASEMTALRKVSQRLPPGTVPRVCGHAKIQGPSDATLSMFMADWFDGFHEFHLSIDPQTGRQGMVVWDTDRAPYYLSEKRQAEVYRQTAFLLTQAYNPVTSEQIYPWHHASGDFVVRVSNERVAMRLITIRQYAQTLGSGEDELDEEARLMALLVFFLNLTMRNRIDRLDGTGDAAWAGDAAVPATVQGFFEGLDEPIGAAIKPFLKSYTLSELAEVLAGVADQFRLMPREKALIDVHLAAHAEHLYTLFQGSFGAA